jgi:hypothetical protein
MQPSWRRFTAQSPKDLTRGFGQGAWSSAQSERGVLAGLRRPQFSRTVIARSNRRIAGTLRLARKQPWAIDIGYLLRQKDRCI